MIGLILVLYITIALAYIAIGQQNTWGHALLKAFPILLLAVSIIFLPFPRNLTLWLMVAALLLSAAGDIFLALDDDGNYFVQGLGSFLLAHIVYAIAFAQSAVFQTLSLIPMILIVLLGIYVTWRIWDGLDELKIPVILYILVSMVMGFSAAIHSPLSWVLIAGALIFMISDSIIAWDKFWMSVRGRDAWVMGTYYAAQLLIWWGMFLPVGL